MYVGRSTSDAPAYLTTFRRTYLRRWKRFLTTSANVTMGECTTCENIEDIRRQSVTREEKAPKQKHTLTILPQWGSDRRLDDRTQEFAGDCCRAANPLPAWTDAVLNWDQDWVCQANFRCPRDTTRVRRRVASTIRHVWCHQILHMFVHVSRTKTWGETRT